MKTKIAILVTICVLLVSCTPETTAQESEVATEAPVTEASVTQEPVVTGEPIATEAPTEAPTNTPIACVTLLTPINGAEIPPVGKATFSWTPMDEAGSYVLNIILPSGETVPFDTDQPIHDRYMEAFVAGGEYQWQVIAQGTDGSDICVSEVSTFDKPAYEKSTGSNGNGGDNDGSSGVTGGSEGGDGDE